MKYLLLISLLICSFPLSAGGDIFRVRVIQYEEFSRNEHGLLFEPLSAPYGLDSNVFVEGEKKVWVQLKLGCSEGFLVCTFFQRRNSKKEHQNALSYLAKIATPGAEITLGLLASGFVKIENRENTYTSNGTFMSNGIVYIYEKSH